MKPLDLEITKVIDRDNKTSKAIIIINDYHRLDVNREILKVLIQDLETVYQQLEDTKETEQTENNRKIVMDTIREYG